MLCGEGDLTNLAMKIRLKPDPTYPRGSGNPAKLAVKIRLKPDPTYECYTPPP
jgi:hypothetical protein